MGVVECGLYGSPITSAVAGQPLHGPVSTGDGLDGGHCGRLEATPTLLCVVQWYRRGGWRRPTCVERVTRTACCSWSTPDDRHTPSTGPCVRRGTAPLRCTFMHLYVHTTRLISSELNPTAEPGSFSRIRQMASTSRPSNT